MTQASWVPYWPKLQVYEGGNDDDPRDPGGRTSRGITQREYDSWRTRQGLPKRDVWIADIAEVYAIYEREYLAPIRFDDLPAGTDVATADPAINNGVSRASGWLQEAVGAKLDHTVGDETVAQANAADVTLTIKAICAKRLGFDQALKNLWKTFGVGWARRIADVEAFALGLHLRATNASPSTIAVVHETEAASATRDRENAQTKAGTATAGGVAGGAAQTAVPADHRWMLIAIGVVVAVVVVRYFWQAHVNRLRADAHTLAATA